MDIFSSLWIGVTSNLGLLVAGVGLIIVIALAKQWASGLMPEGPPPESMDALVFIGVVIGARTVAMAPDLRVYLEHPLDVVLLSQGLSFYGALGGGAVALWFVARKGGGFAAFGDAFALALPVGIALHRLGCLAYGFCGGRPAPFPFGIPLPGHIGTRYPSELIEGFVTAGLFFVLLALSRRPRPAGLLAAVFLAVYPLVRAGVDLTRFPTGPLPWSDFALSFVLGLVGVVLLSVIIRSGRCGAPAAIETQDAVRWRRS